MFESNSVLLSAIAIVGIVFAVAAVKTRTWWWIPGALFLAGAGLIAIDALTMPPQSFRAVLIFIEILAASFSMLFGFAILHGVSSWRERMARLEALDDAGTPTLPTATAVKLARR
jgi:hypothetical protein